MTKDHGMGHEDEADDWTEFTPQQPAISEPKVILPFLLLCLLTLLAHLNRGKIESDWKVPRIQGSRAP